MKLYYSPGACSLAVHIMLEWMNKPYELILANKNDPAFKAANPMLAVPTLAETSIGTLNQCGAILRYLASFPEGQVFAANPNDPADIYEFDRWECFFTGDVHPSFYPFFSPQRYIMDSDDDAYEKVISASVLLVERTFQILNTHLENHEFIVGGHLSIIDAYATPMLRWAKHGMPEKFKTYSSIERHYNMMCSDRKIIMAMQQQGIEA
ncbi:glutathione S-transferase family protein [Serratia sp. JSRIV001]|uniref:glutathione S-transferase family protein n=1 Tax=Serratia TaxID=613 RepID=UPI000402C59E|nr:MULTISPECIES: glutathione S-transferase family protein [Serratia]UAN45142.1 glutathione S-transferase family protein [Serratia sp. JSRIV001]UAN50649.1 glutathione S-transferase family protein [Serratia sp. JSRIV002]UAN56606.1 glutathione S-transferase family protein [Serratia sp. JSRIV004]UAN62213.1 glutathione S-transferase family protein [Serratia sp. JSRIV006]